MPSVRRPLHESLLAIHLSWALGTQFTQDDGLKTPLTARNVSVVREERTWTYERSATFEESILVKRNLLHESL